MGVQARAVREIGRSRNVRIVLNVIRSHFVPGTLALGNPIMNCPRKKALDEDETVELEAKSQ